MGQCYSAGTDCVVFPSFVKKLLQNSHFVKYSTKIDDKSKIHYSLHFSEWKVVANLETRENSGSHWTLAVWPLPLPYPTSKVWTATPLTLCSTHLTLVILEKLVLISRAAVPSLIEKVYIPSVRWGVCKYYEGLLVLKNVYFLNKVYIKSLFALQCLHF